MTRTVGSTFSRVIIACALAATALVAAGCASQLSDVPAPKNLPQHTVEVSVFFSTGRTLLQEKRVVDATNVYRATLDKMLAADPQSVKGLAVVQTTAGVRSVKFKDGVITVDWAPEVLDFKGADREKLLAWSAFLETFGQFPEVKKLAFTVDGKTSGTVNGKDIQNFWGNVTLKNQPWPILRPLDFVDPNASTTTSTPPSGSKAATATK